MKFKGFFFGSLWSRSFGSMISLTFFLLASPSSAKAFEVGGLSAGENTDEFEKVDEKADESEPSILDEYGDKADEIHETVTDNLLLSANWLDSFFRDDRMEYEENKTNLRLRVSTLFEEGEDVDFKARTRLRLVLPGFQDKLHVVLAGDHNEDNTTKYDALNDHESDETSDNDLNLSLRYFFRAARSKNISFRVGLRISDFPPVIFMGPRYSVSKNFDPWVLRFTQDVRYYSDDGWQSRSTVDFERPVAERLFFRTTAEGKWFEDDVGYFYELRSVLFHVLDENSAFEYQWNNFFETRPDHRLDEVMLRVKYRRRIWRKWLFLEIAPQLLPSETRTTTTRPLA